MEAYPETFDGQQPQQQQQLVLPQSTSSVCHVSTPSFVDRRRPLQSAQTKADHDQTIVGNGVPMTQRRPCYVGVNHDINHDHTYSRTVGIDKPASDHYIPVAAASGVLCAAACQMQQHQQSAKQIVATRPPIDTATLPTLLP